MDEAYGSYVDDECSDVHHSDDTDHDADNVANDDTDNKLSLLHDDKIEIDDKEWLNPLE